LEEAHRLVFGGSMRGVILAGGTGSRLMPLTKTINKNLLPVADVPMIYHPIRRLVEAGITDIMVITGVEHAGDIIKCLGSGIEFGCKFTYKVQDKPLGIAHGLGLAKDFCGEEKFILLLGDNIFTDSLDVFISRYEEKGKGAYVLLKEVPDPKRYGVCVFNSHKKIVRVEEKPQKPKSNYIVVGIYMYDSNVFDVISNLKPSDRGELEITDVNNAYIKKGILNYGILINDWVDAGTMQSLKEANLLIERNEK
jgi:glucose-1-phosphate thymidylyltransferase